VTDGFCDYRNEFCHNEKGTTGNLRPLALSMHWIPRHRYVNGADRLSRVLWMQRRDMASKERDFHILKPHFGGLASYHVCASSSPAMGRVLMVSTVIIGEIANFAAYAFAPAILVTPLGALSVLIGAVLGSYFLKEALGTLGKLGCAICLIGSVIIVLHAPPDKEIKTIDEILHYALQPGKISFISVLVT
jgi:hypothetical protein